MGSNETMIDCLIRESETRILHAFQHLEHKLMSALDNISNSVANLQQQVAASNAKTDTVLAVLADVRAQLATLQAGGSATPDQLAALQQQIDAATASLAGEAVKEDAALAPAEPAPAPAPTDSAPSTDAPAA